VARLDGKTALVTGGSRGIGRAIAERLAADGAEVVLSYATNEGAAADVVKAITAAGGRAHAVAADLRFPESARQLFVQAEKMVGPLDILVNNAAIGVTGLIAETADEDFDATMTTNLRSFGTAGGSLTSPPRIRSCPGLAWRPTPRARQPSKCSAGSPPTN